MAPPRPPTHPGSELEEIRTNLERFQLHLRDHVLESRRLNRPEVLAAITTRTKADTIYRIDRLSEEGVLEWFDRHWPDRWAAELVMEGLEDAEKRVVPAGRSASDLRLKIIIDPIDGTRGLLHDKRPAWILTGVAPWKDEISRLGDIEVAVMTEIPTTRQWRSDQVSAIRGRGRSGVRSVAHDLIRGRSEPVTLHPSGASGFEQGFASFARFLPEGKGLLAAFEEEFWRLLSGPSGPLPVVFEDQYIATGGQLYELMAGHDRMIGDFRPMAFRRLGLKSGLVCHPYDICTALILEEMGGVVQRPDGGALDAPLTTTDPVSWVGFANRELAVKAMPVIGALLPRFFT